MTRANVVYYGDASGATADLAFAYRDTSGVWHTEVIESGVYYGFGATLDVKVDSAGTLHVCYGTTAGRVKHAYGNAGSWATEFVSPVGQSCWFPDIATASDGYPHICYGDSTDDDLKYAYKDAGGWNIESVFSVPGEIYPRYNSIALDGNDVPHISWFRDTPDDLMYSEKTSGSWITVALYSVADCGRFNSIAVDSNGYPRIAWQQHSFVAPGRVWHSYNHGHWHHTLVDNTDRISFSKMSLAIDSDDYSHITWYNHVDDDLMRSYDGAGGWTTEVIDTGGNVGKASSITIDDDDYANVCYYDQTNDALKFAYQDVSGWNTEVIDNSGNINSVWSGLVLGGIALARTYFLLA